MSKSCRSNASCGKPRRGFEGKVSSHWLRSICVGKIGPGRTPRDHATHATASAWSDGGYRSRLRGSRCQTSPLPPFSSSIRQKHARNFPHFHILDSDVHARDRYVRANNGQPRAAVDASGQQRQNLNFGPTSTWSLNLRSERAQLFPTFQRKR